MKALPEFVLHRYREIDEIILAVNERNIAAQQLYLKLGFLDRGVRKMGIHGQQLILHNRIT